jgi:hypothetical protein
MAFPSYRSQVRIPTSPTGLAVGRVHPLISSNDDSLELNTLWA